MTLWQHLDKEIGNKMDMNVTNPGDITTQLHCCWREVDGVIEEAVAEVSYPVELGDVIEDDEQGRWIIGRPESKP